MALAWIIAACSAAYVGLVVVVLCMCTIAKRADQLQLAQRAREARAAGAGPPPLHRLSAQRLPTSARRREFAVTSGRLRRAMRGAPE